MANIVYISKYPPMEGGIASKTYWLARALGRAGHTIHLVTDPLNTDAVHSIPEADHHLPDTTGVIVHRADQDVPWHIPNDSHRAIFLLDKALEVILQYKPELIVGGYLVPYGIVAFQASQITDIPYVLLHGGSDINKFLLKDVWPNIIPKVIENAGLVITDADSHSHIERYTSRIKILPPYVPDPSIFKPTNNRHKEKAFRLALIGKANYLWRHKGWQQVMNLWSALGEEFELAVVSQGIGLEDFRSSVPRELRDRITWQPFVPPWEMPKLLHNFDGIFYLHNQLPFPMFSNLVLESLSCGCAVITDSSVMSTSYRKHGIDLGGTEANILFLAFKNSTAEASTVTEHLFKHGDSIFLDSTSVFNHYLISVEKSFLATMDKDNF